MGAQISPVKSTVAHWFPQILSRHPIYLAGVNRPHLNTGLPYRDQGEGQQAHVTVQILDIPEIPPSLEDPAPDPETDPHRALGSTQWSLVRRMAARWTSGK